MISIRNGSLVLKSFFSLIRSFSIYSYGLHFDFFLNEVSVVYTKSIGKRFYFAISLGFNILLKYKSSTAVIFSISFSFLFGSKSSLSYCIFEKSVPFLVLSYLLFNMLEIRFNWSSSIA